MSKYSITTVNGTSPITEVARMGYTYFSFTQHKYIKSTNFSTKYTGFGDDPFPSNGSFFQVLKFPFYIDSNYTTNYDATGDVMYGNSGINDMAGSTYNSSSLDSGGGPCGETVSGTIDIPETCTSIILFMISPGAGASGGPAFKLGKTGSGGMFTTYSIPRSKTDPTSFSFNILGGGGGGGSWLYGGAGGYPGENGHPHDDNNRTDPKPSQNNFDCYVNYNSVFYRAYGATPGVTNDPGSNTSTSPDSSLISQNSPGISTDSGYSGTIIDTVKYGIGDYSQIGKGGDGGSYSKRGRAGTRGMIIWRFMFHII